MKAKDEEIKKGKREIEEVKEKYGKEITSIKEAN